VAYCDRMEPVPMTLSDLEGHFNCFKPLSLIYFAKYSAY